MKYKVDAIVITERSGVDFPKMAHSKGFEWERMYNADNPPLPYDLRGDVVLAQVSLPPELAVAAHRVVNLKRSGEIRVFRYVVEYTHRDDALCAHCKTFTGEEKTHSVSFCSTHSEGYLCSECEQRVHG